MTDDRIVKDLQAYVSNMVKMNDEELTKCAAERHLLGGPRTVAWDLYIALMLRQLLK